MPRRYRLSLPLWCPQGAEPARHWLSLPLWCPASSLPLAALARPAPGERTISNAEVPLPRSPLSLAAGSAHQYRVLTATPRQVSECHLNPASQEAKPPAGYLLGRLCKCRRRFNARGAGGGSPRRNKVIFSPFPTGEGGRGHRGQKRKLKAGRQATKKASPPPGAANARRAGNAGGTPPAERVIRPHSPAPRGFRRGDARGEAPCIK